MSKVRITTDSPCDMSPELVKKYDVAVMPFHVTLGDDTYSDDGVQITQKKLFEYTATTGQLAKTSAVSIGEYLDFFGEFLADGSEIVHIGFSSGLSVSQSNARLAAEELEGVHIVDSKNLSSGMALLVIKACEMRDAGRSAKEITDEIESLADCVDASFVIDTLDNLHKGGRCSAVAKLGANLLKLKPCIEVHGGKMGVHKKFRGNIANVIPEYIKSRLVNLDDIDTSRVFVTHTCAEKPETVKAAMELVKSITDFDEVLEGAAGCTIATHCGPDTLGVLFIRKTPIDKDQSAE